MVDLSKGRNLIAKVKWAFAQNSQISLIQILQICDMHANTCIKLVVLYPLLEMYGVGVSVEEKRQNGTSNMSVTCWKNDKNCQTLGQMMYSPSMHFLCLCCAPFVLRSSKMN